jgi:hypothetical protein
MIFLNCDLNGYRKPKTLNESPKIAAKHFVQVHAIIFMFIIHAH